MGREVNGDRIRELEEKIEEGLGDTIQLKRTRNSLLNISTRVPPEILGEIFWWRIQLDLYQLRGSLYGTYNFLLVCHHWFEVASRTPELWSYWGNTMGEWLRQYKRPGTTPVDLVLDRLYSWTPFDEPLREALQERAKSDTIRSIRLLNKTDPDPTPVLSTLTPDDGDIRYTSIESITLRDVDASNFFARCHFPKLWYLHLSINDQFPFSSWEHLALHTTALTTLVLEIEIYSSIPTTTQLLSILASNHRLQNLTLLIREISREDEDRSATPVPLRHLRKLSINGKFHPVFQWLLQRLDYPEIMEETKLTFACCTVEDILGIFGPYVHHHIQRDGRFRDGLAIVVDYTIYSVSIRVSTTKDVTFATFTAVIGGFRSRHDVAQLCTKFIAQIQVEYVVYLEGDLSVGFLEEAVPMMPNIRELYLINPRLSGRFLQSGPEGSLAQKKVLPSLRRLHLECPFLGYDGWRPLLLYLGHQTSDDQRISLTIANRRDHLCEDELEEMESMVDELQIPDLIPDYFCPSEWCAKGKGVLSAKRGY